MREVDPGLTSVKPCDHFIPLDTPKCRQCKSCLSGKTTVLPEIAVAKIREGAPFKTSCYVRLWGDDRRRRGGQQRQGAGRRTIIVFGLGSAGLNVLRGVKMAGANMIIGIDINPDREESGRKSV